ncbi:MAG: hypothetical protein Q9225_005023 [Loekoesia sp. 1 TL-2023]
MDNGRRVVAKLPFSLAGPPRLTTDSEVATIRHRESKPYKPVQVFLSQESSTGMMTPQTTLGASISLWNTPLAFNCIRSGQPWPDVEITKMEKLA